MLVPWVSYYPLWGVVVGIHSLAMFRVKTLARHFGLGGGEASHRYPLVGWGSSGSIRVQHMGVIIFGVLTVFLVFHGSY
jgi:hypothetical protein